MAAPSWPFPTRSPGQYRRVDQGWDLQYPGTRPVLVLAVAPGTLRNAGPDPQGFGPGYPLLVLDTPVLGYPAIYYGHCFTDRGRVGRHVRQGEPVGMTGGLHSGGNAYADSNWLEIGFWRGGPAAGGVAGPSLAGVEMRRWLGGASAGVVVPALPVAAGPRSGRSPVVALLVAAGLLAGVFVVALLGAGVVAWGIAAAGRKAMS